MLWQGLFFFKFERWAKDQVTLLSEGCGLYAK